MIDLHAHVLPGLDDGPADMEEAVAMCRVAAADGIRTLVAVAHMLNGLHRATPQDILDGVAALRRRLAGESIPLEVLPGAEVHVAMELPGMLSRREVLTVADRGRFVLLELPQDVVPEGLERLLFSVRLLGITPILAHPERNFAIQSRPELLAKIAEPGHLVQVTAGSLTGYFGEAAHDCGMLLLQAGLCHLVASDSHSSTGRVPRLSEARAAVQDAAGKEAARIVFDENPNRVLRGEEVCVRPEGPAGRTKKGGWLKRFFA